MSAALTGYTGLQIGEVSGGLATPYNYSRTAVNETSTLVEYTPSAIRTGQPRGTGLKRVTDSRVKVSVGLPPRGIKPVSVLAHMTGQAGVRYAMTILFRVRRGVSNV